MIKRNRNAVLAAAVVGLSIASVAHATASTWAANANGNWSVPTNWSTNPTIPNGVGDSATFTSISSNLVAPTVTQDVVGLTLGAINFDANTLKGFTISGTNAITLNQDGAGLGSASITVTGVNGAVNNTVSTPLTLGDNLSIATGTYASLTLSGAIGGAGTIAKAGVGLASLSYTANNFVGNIAITGGILQVAGDGSLGDAANDVSIDQNGILKLINALALSAGRVITIGDCNATIDAPGPLTAATAGQLTGAGIFTKQGSGVMTVSQPNVGLTGPVHLLGGITDASSSASAAALGSGRVTIGDIAQLALADVAQTSKFTVLRGGNLVGSATSLASLNRATNLDARTGSTIIETVAGANSSIASLGSAADLIFGVQGTLASENVTVGTGTAWQGIGIGLSNGVIQSGAITVNGNFTISGGIGSPDPGRLTLGNGATSQVSFPLGSAPGVASIVGGNGVGVGGMIELAGNNTGVDFSGISKFSVAAGGILWATGANAFGGKTVDIESGGQLGHTGSGALTVTANSYGASTINIASASQINMRGAANMAFGGTLNVDSTLPALINVNRDSTAAGAGTLSVTSLNFITNNSGLILTNGSSRTFDAGTVAGGSNNFTLSLQYALTMAATFTGSGTFTKGDNQTLTLTGNLSGYTGNVVVATDSINMNPAVATNIFGGTAGTSLYKIADATTPQSNFRGYATLQVNTDLDFNTRIDSASTGILGLGVNNSTLTGVNGSAVYIAPAGAARTLSTATLAAGSGATYRLGGGFQALTLDSPGAGVLTGANALVIGGPRNGSNAWFFGTVILNDSNAYTSSTRVNTSSVLTLNSASAIGNGASLGDIDIHGTMNVGGTTGTGTIGAAAPANINIRPGGTLLIDNSVTNVADRIPNATAVNIAGATLSFGALSGAATTEALGATTLQAGFNTITLTRPNVNGTVPTLTLSSLTRNAGAQANINLATSGLLGTTSILTATGFATGLAPGIYANNTDFAEYNGAAFVALTGTRPTLAAATAGSNPVSTGNDTLPTSRSVNSYRITGAATVNLNGNTLTTANLMHTDATAVTISNGSITAPGSELIINGTSSATTISANITGAVGLTVRSSGALTLNLTGTANSFSGHTYLNGGTTVVTSPLTGNPSIDINPGATLFLKNNASTAFLTGGTITVKAAEETGSTISVDNNGSGTLNEARIHNLTVEPNASLFVSNGNSYKLGTTGAVTLGAGSAVSLSSSTESGLIIHGTYSDTATTRIPSFANTFSGRNRGLVFDNGISSTVNAIMGMESAPNRTTLTAQGAGTIVNFQGYFLGSGASSHLSAWDGAKLVIGANATIDNSLGWQGTSYTTIGQVALNGDNGGTIEFDPGFVAAKTTGTLDRTDVNFGGNLRAAGGNYTVAFAHTQNWPAYQGYITVDANANDITFQTKTNDQVFPGIVQTLSSTNFDQQTNLELSGPVLVGAPIGSAITSLVREWAFTGTFGATRDMYSAGTGRILKKGPGVLTLSGPLFNSAGAVEVAAGTLNITGPQTHLAGASIVASGGTLNVSTNAGNADVANATLVASGGTLNLNVDQNLSAIKVNSGSIVFNASNLTAKANCITFGITPGGQLDLTDGKIVLDYAGPSPMPAMLTALNAGRNGYDTNIITNWNGKGIISSKARTGSVAAGFNLYTIGLINNADLADGSIGRDTYSTFGGVATDDSSVLLRYTYSGDADLNGLVDGDDYALIDNAFNALIPNFGWMSGDFNYDGNINGDDYALIDSGFLFQTSPIPASATSSTVPEPATLGTLALGMAGLMCRRNRCATQPCGPQ